ncbi:glycerol kinase-like [Camellia sinensis]|uniref:glycerol kinase-like n=1 Tax=Camellia sinensis TaxID=4442 RepID=UPI001035EC64|nr:glycerol kinase-like [Camellia sinensis]
MQVDSTGGVYFLLAFDGLFTPWWRDDACGVCIGITRFMNRFHIARAVRESMCFQADLLGNPVVRPADIETTALGAAYAAGLAIGVWTGGNFFFWGKEGKKLPFSVQH